MPHNVDAVIGDIENTKDDLHDKLETRINSLMRAVRTTAVENVTKDADYTGNLRKSLSVTLIDRGDKLVGKVGTDPEIAPYAPFVEFGTGLHGKPPQTAPQPNSELPRPPMEGSPIGYPFESPDTPHGLVSSIVEWVHEKPVFPDNPNITQQQLGYIIAAQIVEQGTYAHPFLQPAWFRHERQIWQGIINAVRGAFR